MTGSSGELCDFRHDKGSPAISMILKREEERPEMDIPNWSQFMNPRFSNVRELSLKLRVSQHHVPRCPSVTS
jgi:hypothetical protein